jgi:hypothetical protein
MSWVCHACQAIVDDFVLKCPSCGAIHPREFKPREDRPGRDVPMEGHLLAAAAWLRILAVAGVLAIAAVIALDPQLRLPIRVREALPFLGGAACVGIYVAGHRLAGFSDRARGWAGLACSLASIGAVFLAVVSRHAILRLAAAAATFAALAAIASVLFHPRAARVCSGPYRAVFPREPRARPARSWLAWIPLVPAALHAVAALE